MRRQVLISFFLLIAAGVLAGCGSDDDHGGHATMPMHDTPHHMGAGHGESSPVADGAREIAIVADDFTFSPDRIVVRAGEDIALVLTSVDILHDLNIDELDVHVAADRGETEKGGLRAEEPGRFRFYCSVEGHQEAGMEGTLVVE